MLTGSRKLVEYNSRTICAEKDTYAQLYVEEQKQLHCVYTVAKVRELHSQVKNIIPPISVGVIFTRLHNRNYKFIRIGRVIRVEANATCSISSKK